MKAKPEKRSYERRSYNAPIVFSHFNKKQLFDAQTLNHCGRGMSFKSNVFLQTGATLYIRVKEFHPNGSCTGLCEGLRSATLAEVKWCHEAPGAEASPYGVGVKYFETVY